MESKFGIQTQVTDIILRPVTYLERLIELMEINNGEWPESMEAFMKYSLKDVLFFQLLGQEEKDPNH